jgi:mitotic spindle assembly checkpoint protein MAD1
VLHEENYALKRGAASADELRETVVWLEAEVEAARVKPEVWCVSPFIPFCISGANLMGGIRARNAVSETPTKTPVSITQSLSALHLEHEHLLEEHGADCAALHQREAELADAHATAYAPLQAIRAAENHRTPLRIAALAEWEVGFLKALNIRSPLDCLLSLSSLGS